MRGVTVGYMLVPTLACLAGSTGAWFAVQRREVASLWRVSIALLAFVLLILSTAVYLYALSVAFQLNEAVSFSGRINILLPRYRVGSAFNDVAFILSFFAVKRARMFLIVGNLAMLVVYWGVFVSV